MLQAAQTWVVYINGQGGLNGHPVKLFVYDEGGDPARAKAQIQEAVEQRHVVAFLQQSGPLTGQCCIDYITAKRIPVIGSEQGSPWYYDTSPMYFPQASSGELLTLSAMYAAADQAIPAGKTKLAFLTCTENPNCKDLPERAWTRTAPKLGFQIVYKASTSLAQPDFTAECLAAQNAHAQVMLLALDTNTVGRVGASCARQGFRPIYGIIGGNIVSRMKDDPNLDGAVGSTNVFPWFQSETPATAQYQQVMRTLGSKVSQGVASTVGWVSAKVLEKVGANMPEPPTSDAILRGLWSLHNEDLGGLTQPLTFVENRPSSPALCLWILRIKDSDWVSPDGLRRHCYDL